LNTYVGLLHSVGQCTRKVAPYFPISAQANCMPAAGIVWHGMKGLALRFDAFTTSPNPSANNSSILMQLEKTINGRKKVGIDRVGIIIQTHGIRCLAAQ